MAEIAQASENIDRKAFWNENHHQALMDLHVRLVDQCSRVASIADRLVGPIPSPDSGATAKEPETCATDNIDRAAQRIGHQIEVLASEIERLGRL